MDKISKLTFGTSFFFPLLLPAMPFKAQVCPEYNRLARPDNASFLYSKDCSRIYIKPPESGRITFANPMIVTTAKQCQRINDRRNAIMDRLVKLEELQERLWRERSRSSIQSKSGHLWDAIEKIALEIMHSKSTLRKTESLVAQLLEQHREAKAKLGSCLGAIEISCDRLKYEISDLSGQLTAEQQRASWSADEIIALEAEKEGLQTLYDMASSFEEKDSAQRSSLEEERQSLEDRHDMIMEKLAKKAGAFVNFTLFSDFAAHVDKVKRMNPSFASRMEAIPIKKAVIRTVSTPWKDNRNYPIIMENLVAGLEFVPEGGNQDVPAVEGSDDMQMSGSTVKNYLGGTAITGRVLLNQVGVCGATRNGSFQAELLESVVTASMIYKYDEMVERYFMVYRSIDLWI